MAEHGEHDHHHHHHIIERDESSWAHKEGTVSPLPGMEDRTDIWAAGAAAWPINYTATHPIVFTPQPVEGHAHAHEHPSVTGPNDKPSDAHGPAPAPEHDANHSGAHHAGLLHRVEDSVKNALHKKTGNDHHAEEEHA